MGQHKNKGVQGQLQRFQNQAAQGRIIQIGSEPLMCKCGGDVLILHQLVRVRVDRMSKQMQLDSVGPVFTCTRCGATVSPQAEEKPSEGLPVTANVQPAEIPAEPAPSAPDAKQL